MMEKVSLEIQKIKKNTNKIEWTETLELPYENEKKVLTIKEKEEIINNNFDQVINPKVEKEELINTKILSMEGNPFHQPSMNTLEFEDEENILIVNISKENSTAEIQISEKLLALDKLYEDKIITKKEYDKKKNKILLGE